MSDEEQGGLATIYFDADRRGPLTIARHSKFMNEILFCTFVGGKFHCRPSCPFMKQHPLANGKDYCGNVLPAFDRMVICDLMTRVNPRSDTSDYILYYAIGITEQKLPDYLVEPFPLFER